MHFKVAVVMGWIAHFSHKRSQVHYVAAIVLKETWRTGLEESSALAYGKLPPDEPIGWIKRKPLKILGSICTTGTSPSSTEQDSQQCWASGCFWNSNRHIIAAVKSGPIAAMGARANLKTLMIINGVFLKHLFQRGGWTLGSTHYFGEQAPFIFSFQKRGVVPGLDRDISKLVETIKALSETKLGST